MKLTGIQQECLNVMENASFAYLTTVDANGVPATRAMLNLRNKREYAAIAPLYESEENPLTVYMTTNTSSGKIGEIQHNGKACLYFCEPQSFHGIMLQGTVEIANNELRKKVWQPGWEIYYPKGDEDYSVLRFIPNKIKTYSNYTVASEEI